MPFHSTSLLVLAGLVRIAFGSSASACTTKTFVPLKLSNIEITSLNVAPVYNYSAEAVVSTATVSPATSAMDICLISLTYTHPGQDDTINTLIGLPLDAKDWNSRFLMSGGGGWLAGGVNGTLAPPLLSGYSSSTTDGGHNISATTAEWGLVSDGNTNWPALSDFASVALAEAAVLGKMATEIYFGSAPRYSYWNGCSTGGRQGHMMAQQYPQLFDGIVGGSPAINWDKFIPSEFWPPFMAQLLDVQPPACVLNAFTNAAIAACDLLDGVKDSIIASPEKCHFNAFSLVGQTILCNDPSQNANITITHDMAELVTAIWNGPSTADGRFEWYGFHHDANLASILSTNCTFTDTYHCTVTPFSISDDWVKVFLVRNSSFDTTTLTSRTDYDRLFRQSIAQYASAIGTENADLTDMKLAGTKMIAWHGMQDELIPTDGTVDYYKRVREFDPDVDEYYRFFLAPGVEHCGGGAGFDPSDSAFGTLKAWVENGTVPDRLEASAAAVGWNTSATRMAYLCPYPKTFTYTGGSPDSPSSFSCV